MARTDARGVGTGDTLTRRTGWAVISPAAIVVLVFFVGPVVYFLRFSFETPSATEFAIPTFTVKNFSDFFTDSYYVHTLIRTLLIAVASTLLTLVLAVPVARLIATCGPKMKSVLIIATVFPLLVGNVVRSIGWVAILGYNGVVNTVLVRAHLIDDPVDLLHSPITVGIAISSVVVPIMVLTLQASMEALDPAVERAALSLGSRRFRAFVTVTLPQIVPGIIAGTSLVFVLCLNAYATPLLVGGSQVPMLAPEIYSSITTNNNWPFGAAMAAILLVLCLVVVVLYGWLVRRWFEGWRRESR